ncbi:MAG: hypothetical protein J7K68_01935 [Candidatus Diapherotrites archaeon]|nr:hypothetical protein [Candidatus Diapherotrites archaeon]
MTIKLSRKEKQLIKEGERILEKEEQKKIEKMSPEERKEYEEYKKLYEKIDKYRWAITNAETDEEAKRIYEEAQRYIDSLPERMLKKYSALLGTVMAHYLKRDPGFKDIEF